MKEVIDAVIAVTYRCNARCLMCEIWKKTHPQELLPKAYQNLPPSLKYVNLTGGEPSLRKDLVEIAKVVRQACPKAQIILSTNGFLTKKIVDDIEKIRQFDPKIGVRVSLDGIGEKHDHLRGVKGAYQMALATIRELLQMGLSNLGMGFTACDLNLDQIIPVFKLSQKLGIDFSLALAQCSEFFFGKLGTQRISNLDILKENLEFLIRNHLLSFNYKMWGRAFFEYGAWKFASEGKRILPDGAGIDSCFISPTGDVYPSNYINEVLGNLGEETLDTIWESGEAKAVREKIKRGKTPKAWMICTLRGSFEKNKWQILRWALKNKARVHLGRTTL